MSGAAGQPLGGDRTPSLPAFVLPELPEESSNSAPFVSGFKLPVIHDGSESDTFKFTLPPIVSEGSQDQSSSLKAFSLPTLPSSIGDTRAISPDVMPGRLASPLRLATAHPFRSSTQSTQPPKLSEKGKEKASDGAPRFNLPNLDGTLTPIAQALLDALPPPALAFNVPELHHSPSRVPAFSLPQLSEPISSTLIPAFSLPEIPNADSSLTPAFHLPPLTAGAPIPTFALKLGPPQEIIPPSPQPPTAYPDVRTQDTDFANITDAEMTLPEEVPVEVTVESIKEKIKKYSEQHKCVASRAVSRPIVWGGYIAHNNPPHPQPLLLTMLESNNRVEVANELFNTSVRETALCYDYIKILEVVKYNIEDLGQTRL
ncbi:hypothetical protein BXZ70DRAFT_910405 [Cristinia sonorae]|uniref:Uncharacterized protein n=1 Tax=Cristinia sonorae TaxID=1940300 RepID=A0A8K0UGK8_9AGAR|nr:hypothetical protein BXZ70DRAFT_910405 [Cristinia sonorae]